MRFCKWIYATSKTSHPGFITTSIAFSSAIKTTASLSWKMAIVLSDISVFFYSLLKSFDPSKQKQLENDRNLSNLGPAKPLSSGRFVSVKSSKPAPGNRIRSASTISEDGTPR